VARRPLPLTVVPPTPAPRDDRREILHGIEVEDPFRPLEDGADPATRAWVAAENRRTEAVLAQLPDRERLRWRLRGLLGAESSVSCAVGGDRVFSLERWGPHDQAVLVYRDAGTPGRRRTIVDPTGPGDPGDTTAAIDWYRPSPDGRLVAYGVSTGGDERSTLHVVDVDSGNVLPDRIPHTRACSVAWLPDASAFAYTRYPEPDDVPPGEAEYWRTVYWHRLGDDWHADDVLWRELPDRTAWANVELSADGRWLLVHLSLGWSRVDVHLVDRTTGARTVMIEGIEAVSSFSVVGDRVVGLTTLDADRGRIVAAPLATAWHDRWRTVVPESERVLDAVTATASSLLVLSSRDAVAQLDRYDHDGGGHEPVLLPEAGSLAGLDGRRDADQAFFSFTSFTRPPTLYRWQPDGVTPWSGAGEDDDGDDDHDAPPAGAAGPAGGYLVDQLTYAAADGTDIPLLLVRAAGTVPGTDTPCVLSAYGGFGINMAPGYSAAVVAVCDAGGLYAVAGVRGGGERGESWHEAGKRANKQTTFDDFIAAADWLVDHGYTSRERLAVRGGSNGGLLMGAALTQRPDLCRAAQIAVPLADMVRYPRFLIARLWIPEYGDPDHPTELRWLHAYSPYHRVVDGTCYPAVLLTTAEEDSRVDPLHARKLAARLQEATTCGDDRPILLREEPRAGHGQGKPVSKQADELADVLGFLFWQLGAAAFPDGA
jgi:prolyl oligopeptidase